MEAIALDAPIRAIGAAEAMQQFDNVAAASRRTATVHSQAWKATGNEIIDTVMRTGSAQARSAIMAQLSAEKSSAAIMATTEQRSARTIRLEANLANHFRQMREREIAAAERAAYAMDKALQRQNRGIVLTTAGFQKWGNAAIRGAGAIALLADAAADTDKDFQTLLRTGSSIAFMFGPYGAIVGSIGIATSLIVSMFKRTDEAMEKTREAAIANVRKMREGMTLEARMGEAVEAQDRRTVLSTERDLLSPKLAQAGRDLDLARQIGKQDVIDNASRALEKLQREAGNVDAEIAALDARMASLGKTIAVLTTAEYQREQQVAAANAILAARAAGPASTTGPAFIRPRGVVEASRVTSPVPSPDVSGAAEIVARNAKAAAKAMEEGMKDPGVQAVARTEAAITDAVDRMGDSIASGLHSAFALAFSGEGIGGLLKGFTGSIVGSLGQMFIELGKHLIGFGTIMETLKKGLASVFTSGPAAVVAGAALIALGAAMTAGAGAIMSGGGGGSRGGGYTSGRAAVEQSSAFRYNPVTTDMTKVDPKIEQNYYTILGGGPQVERWVSGIAKKGDRRQLGGRGSRSIVRISRG